MKPILFSLIWIIFRVLQVAACMKGPHACFVIAKIDNNLADQAVCVWFCTLSDAVPHDFDVIISVCSGLFMPETQSV